MSNPASRKSNPARLARLLIIPLCVLCAACGSFPLATGGTIPPGRTRDQVTLDKLVCKDRAATESHTSGDQARGFMLGLTLSFVGVAIDYEQQKQDQRRIYKSCMEARGYTITLAAD